MRAWRLTTRKRSSGPGPSQAAVVVVRGLNPDALTSLIGASVQEVFGEGVATPDGRETEVVVDLPGGRAEFQMRVSRLVDRHQRDLGSAFVARDVTEANALRRRLAAAHSQLVRQVETIEVLRADLAELASRDPLTGLHNRRYLVERFEAMLAATESAGRNRVWLHVDEVPFATVDVGVL